MKVQPQELTVCLRSDIRHLFQVTGVNESSEVKALVPNKHFLKVSATSSIVTFVFLQDVTIAFFLVHLDDQECYILIIFDISNKNFFEKILKIF